MITHTVLPSRRTILRSALATATAALGATHLAGCSPSSPHSRASSRSAATTGSNVKRVLLAYFSRRGENYYNGGRIDLKVGNTEVLADKIGSRISCDTYRIQAADPYSHDYDATVKRNVREQDTDARPASKVACPPSTATTPSSWPAPSGTSEHPDHDDVHRTPRLPRQDRPPGHHIRHERPGYHRTRLRRLLSRRDHRRGLAVRGEEVKDADTEVEAWLRRIRLPTR